VQRQGSALRGFPHGSRLNGGYLRTTLPPVVAPAATAGRAESNASGDALPTSVGRKTCKSKERQRC